MGGTVTFFVVTLGATEDLEFEWYFGDDDGAIISTTDMLTIDNLVMDSAGDYFVRVTDEDGDSIDSELATLTVTAREYNNIIIMYYRRIYFLSAI